MKSPEPKCGVSYGVGLDSQKPGYGDGTGRGRMGRDGTGRHGTGRDGQGRVGTGRYGTAWDGTGRIFGRMDLRISRSKAKFDVRADGEVRSAVRRPKPHKICEKRNFLLENFATKFFWRRKIKFRESSETRFRKFSRRSEPSLRRKRPFEVPKRRRPRVYLFRHVVNFARQCTLQLEAQVSTRICPGA